MYFVIVIGPLNLMFLQNGALAEFSGQWSVTDCVIRRRIGG
jgi:hypothetical protein